MVLRKKAAFLFLLEVYINAQRKQTKPSLQNDRYDLLIDKFVLPHQGVVQNAGSRIPAAMSSSISAISISPASDSAYSKSKEYYRIVKLGSILSVEIILKNCTKLGSILSIKFNITYHVLSKKFSKKILINQLLFGVSLSSLGLLFSFLSFSICLSSVLVGLLLISSSLVSLG